MSPSCDSARTACWWARGRACWRDGDVPPRGVSSFWLFLAPRPPPHGVFARPSPAGDICRMPKLAITLRAIARRGAAVRSPPLAAHLLSFSPSLTYFTVTQPTLASDCAELDSRVCRIQSEATSALRPPSSSPTPYPLLSAASPLARRPSTARTTSLTVMWTSQRGLLRMSGKQGGS